MPVKWSVKQYDSGRLAGGSLTDGTAEGLVEPARPVRLGHYIPAPKRNADFGADDSGYRCRIVGAGAADRVAEPNPTHRRRSDHRWSCRNVHHRSDRTVADTLALASTVARRCDGWRVICRRVESRAAHRGSCRPSLYCHGHSWRLRRIFPRPQTHTLQQRGSRRGYRYRGAAAGSGSQQRHRRLRVVDKRFSQFIGASWHLGDVASHGNICSAFRNGRPHGPAEPAGIHPRRR